jgi:radical SAM superfamily enzyme YgiQ (UPF0313 family)
MDFALLRPIAMRVLLISANREQLPSPVVPLGLLYVAAAIRDRHAVALLDLCFEVDVAGAIARAVAEHQPEVVGLSLRNLHSNAYDGSERLLAEYETVVRAIRAATSAPLVLGGTAFSLQPERLMTLLGADHGVVGEGESAFGALLDAMAAGEPAPRLLRAAAVAPRDSLTTLARKPAAGELDRLAAPARDLIDPRYYVSEGTENVQTKRGCAFLCSYCDYPDLEGRRVRVRDPERIADEMAARAKVPGVSHVFIVDSVFNVPRSHALATCDALIARGAPIPWVCYASPVNLDEELARRMAQAGCVGAEIGTDAGTDAMLARLAKPFRLAEVRRTRAAFLAAGIADCHTFVLGAEGETAEEAAETLRFVDELDPDVAVFIVFLEDRETMQPHRARHRDDLLALLRAEAPKRPGWVVPELGIRFGEKLTRFVRRSGLRGPSWLHLARQRRAALVAGAG